MAPGQGHVRLVKGREDLALLLGRQADAGVTDPEPHPAGLVRARGSVLSGIQRVQVNRDPHAPLGGELDGIADQVVEDFLEPLRVTAEERWQGRVQGHLQGEPLVPRLGREPRRDIRHQVPRAQGLGCAPRLTGLHQLGKGQQVGQQREQRGGRGVDLGQIVVLPVGQGVTQQRLAQPEYRVQGRADLVPQIGEKGVLGAVGGFGGVPRGPQVGLDLDPVGDVQTLMNMADETAGAVLSRGGRVPKPTIVAITVPQPVIQAERLRLGLPPGRLSLATPSVVGVETGEPIAPAVRLRRPARQRPPGLIDIDTALFPVGDADQGGAAVGEAAPGLLALPQGQVGATIHQYQQAGFLQARRRLERHDMDITGEALVGPPFHTQKAQPPRRRGHAPMHERAQPGPAVEIEELEDRSPPQRAGPAQAEQFLGLAVGLDDEAQPVDDQCRQRQMVEQQPIALQGAGDLALGLNQFLVLELELGLIDAQLLDQLGDIALARDHRGVEPAGETPGDGLLGPGAQGDEIDLGMTHEALPRCQALMLT